jgi:hypothetical protein
MPTDQKTWMNLGIAAGILFAAYKFGPAPAKMGAVAVAAVIIGGQIPYVKDALAL